MTTKLSGSRITGLLALTMEAQAALAVGDPVHITGNYEVNKADGTKPTLGHVSVANVKRAAGAYPVAKVPGDVTVEARGFEVREVTTGAAVTAGVLVKYDNTQKVVAWGVVATGNAVTGDGPELIVGLALMGAGAADGKIDILVR